jgi:hypothetical protein
MVDITQEQIINLIARFPNSPKKIWQENECLNQATSPTIWIWKNKCQPRKMSGEALRPYLFLKGELSD